MTHLFEGIDFFERRFDRADVRAITGLTDKKLDNWSDRRLIPAEDQRPGKGGRRRYHGFEVFALQLMGTLTDRFRIPPGDAVDLAKIVTKEIIECLTAERPNLRVLRVGKKREDAWDDAYVLLWYEDGDWRVLSDYTDWAAPVTMEIHQKTAAHISIPVTRMFESFVNEVCERVYGTEWTRKQMIAGLEMHSIKELRAWLDQPGDFILDTLGCTREDVEQHIAGRRRSRRKKPQ